MADIGDWANAAGGIPLGIMQGYNYGQREQRAEEKALADIENQRLRNELLGYTSGEYMSPGQAEARRTQTELQTLLGQLGITTAGYNLEATQAGGADIRAGLGAQIRAARAGAETQAQRAELGLELFPGQATVARGVSQQNVQMLPETLRIREAGQREQAATIESSLRRLDELTLQSGAVDTLRAAYAANPNAAPFDVMFAAFQNAPDNQKAVIAARMQVQNQQDLGAVSTPEALDQWLQRPIQQFKGRSWVNENGTISIATATGRVNDQGQPTYSQPVIVRDMEEAKNLFGQRVPAGTRQPQTRAAPVTGAALGAAALTGPAGAATPTAAPGVRQGPRVAPTAAPAPAGPMGPPAPAATAAAAAAPAQPSVDQMIQQATARIQQLTSQREQMIGANAPAPTRETWANMVPIEQELNSLQALITRLQQQQQQSAAQQTRQQQIRGARLGFQPGQ